MGFSKLTGSQAILGGAVILNAPKIYTNAVSTSSTSAIKMYGTPEIEATATDATRGGVKFGGMFEYIKQIPFTAASWTTSVTTNFDTSFSIPAKGIVTDAFFDITTVASSLTLTAGIAADPDGFLVTIPTTPVGPKIGGVLATGELYGVLFLDATNPTSATYHFGKVNYVCTSVAQVVAIGRSATNLDMSVVGNLYITYYVPE